jgi:predicted heme/steroid binding protein
MKKNAIILGIFSIIILGIIVFTHSQLAAKPEYADKTRQDCETCHIDTDEGSLNQTGLDYKASGYRWPPVNETGPLLPLARAIKTIIGYLHVVASFAWFGAILYVHLLLKPAYASKGLPKGEVVLGLVSMVMVGITGVLLTLSRIKSFDVLFETSWGLTLLIKILLYSIMLSSAMIVVFLIGPKLKKGRKKGALPKVGIFNPLTLSDFDGNEGKPVFIAYKEKVYDLSKSKLWANGVHYKKHTAGTDLTVAIGNAPHGDEKLEGMKIVGAFDESFKIPKTIEQKLFYFIAYMNLLLVFGVLYVIAHWRWGI